MTKKLVHYVLFHSSTEAMAAYAHLRGRGCAVRIAPAPRLEHVDCGTAVRVEPEALPQVVAGLEELGASAYDRVIEVADAIDPKRDRYC